MGESGQKPTSATMQNTQYLFKKLCFWVEHAPGQLPSHARPVRVRALRVYKKDLKSKGLKLTVAVYCP